jgi:hypothetical protein
VRLRLLSAAIAILAAAGALGISVAPASASTADSVAISRPTLPSLTYAENAWWVWGPLGGTLRITPSGIAQWIGISAAQGIMNNALQIAGWPPYSSYVYKSMFEQLQCHLTARLKTPYDLDSWRPVVSWATEIRTLCNPNP